MTPNEAFDSLNTRRLKQAEIPKYSAVQVSTDNLDLMAKAFKGTVVHGLVDDPEHPEAKVHVDAGVSLPTCLGQIILRPGDWFVNVRTSLSDFCAGVLDDHIKVLFDDDGPLFDRDQLELDLNV